MNILSLEHLTHSYTERKLFDDADFYLHEGDKVGVIGRQESFPVDRESVLHLFLC